LTYAPIIKYIQGSWFALCFAVFLQLINFDTGTSINKVSVSLCVLAIILSLLTVGFFFYKLNFCSQEVKFKEKYDSLFEFYKFDSFWARNFSFLIFIKKTLMMLGLIVLYNWLLPGLILMASSCAGLAIAIFLV
jgi:hypothetical protein